MNAAKQSQLEGKMPQKRRMDDEPDKKVEIKDSKKMRQDDSSSDVDSDAIAQRKSEVPDTVKATEKAKDVTTLQIKRKPAPACKKKKKPDSDVESSEESPTVPKAQEEKKAKKSRPAKKEAMKGIFCTEAVLSCSICKTFFLSKAALEKHQKEKHDNTDSDTYSSDDEPVIVDEETKKKKSPAKIRQERKSNGRSSSARSSSDEARTPEAKRPMHQKSTTAKVGPAKPKPKAKPGPKAKTTTTTTTTTDTPMTQCHICDKTYKSTLHRNHLVNHYREPLEAKLPPVKPFKCPECQNVSRDKITLLRHYAYAHKKIEEHCTVEEIKGKRVSSMTTPADNSEDKSLDKENKSISNGNSNTRALAESLVQSESEDEVPKKQKAKSEDADSEDSTKKETNGKISNVLKDAPVTQPVTFSSDSDDDGFLTTSTKESLKAFDELFSSDIKDKESAPVGKKPVFNKDSDDDDDDYEPSAKKTD